MSRMEKKSSEPAFTVATTSHELRGDYSKAAEDFTIQQDWNANTPRRSMRLWRKLYQRQAALMPKYAAKVVQDSLDELDFSGAIPNLDKVSQKLQAATGWRLVAVPGFIPDTAFFAHLAERRFPVTIWLRKPEEIDYLVEPDIFHDFFGHVPLLFDPVFADFLQLYGVKGAEAERLGMTQYLARLYWYTVEFGLIREGGKIKAFGAGILSSFTETAFCIDDPSPNRDRVRPGARDEHALPDRRFPGDLFRAGELRRSVRRAEADLRRSMTASRRCPTTRRMTCCAATASTGAAPAPGRSASRRAETRWISKLTFANRP